jgi:hypothetical protein
VDPVRNWPVSIVSAGSQNGHYWPVPSPGAAQRSGRSRRNSGHGTDIVIRLLLTHSDTSPPSIDALRKVHSITSSMRSGRGGMAATLRLTPHRQSAESTGSAMLETGSGSRVAPVTADQPGRNAHRRHTLEHLAQGVALTVSFLPRPAKHRMIGNRVLDAELANPPVGQIDLALSASLRV